MSAKKQVQIPGNVSASRCLLDTQQLRASVQNLSDSRVPDISHASRVTEASKWIVSLVVSGMNKATTSC